MKCVDRWTHMTSIMHLLYAHMKTIKV